MIQACMRHMCSWSKALKMARCREHFWGIAELAKQTCPSHGCTHGVCHECAYCRDVLRSRSLAERSSPAMSQRGPRRDYGDYVPCGACTGLVHRSQLQGLTPEETHHSKEELRAFDQVRQMQRDRIGDLNRETALGLIPPEAPVHAGYGMASPVKQNPHWAN